MSGYDKRSISPDDFDTALGALKALFSGVKRIREVTLSRKIAEATCLDGSSVATFLLQLREAGSLRFEGDALVYQP